MNGAKAESARAESAKAERAKAESAKSERLGAAAVLTLVLAYAAFGVFHLSPWAASWDEVDFTLALDRFDLLAMQPHAPGYPYFILGGRLMRLLSGDPVLALGGWNLLLASSSAWPIYRIARRWIPPVSASLAAAIVLTLPMNWTLSVRPMSEGAALALLWWFLWSLVRLAERRSNGRWLAAAFLFGLLMGTRLSYVPFGIGLLIAGIVEARDLRRTVTQRVLRLTGWAASAAAFQFFWVGAVAAAEGGFAETLRLFAGFGEGHFTEWGGGVSQAGLPFGERIWRFAADNWLWTGTFARFVPLAVITGALLIWTAWGWRQRWAVSNRPNASSLRRLTASPAFILAVCVLAYALWALLGQNIAKPRHAAPLAALSMFALAACALRLRIGRSRSAAIVLAVLLAALQAAEGARLVSLQQHERPAVYQLADALAKDSESSAILYTWEEERVLRYLNVPIQTQPIFTYEYFLANAAAERGSRILLTGSVWDEFRRQADVPAAKVRLLAVYRSDSRLDPVYGTIALYEWKG
ncbi:nucleoporin-interacting protein [Cohnella sp. CFH 77786]|uniref:glycosyltransferase family 39 protein n=1 Tax=Cohnella sp. CFH 77786 TaxID=2662265 RepID=UPI001C610D9B|nr:glycosyltransferase family 39 protein [Cohnella sp. CFH 77786]MBW5445931.1 nucleoporin-interacting protein [Cohnella sp. CFH 77786]